jgi:hypothetical protein
MKKIKNDKGRINKMAKLKGTTGDGKGRLDKPTLKRGNRAGIEKFATMLDSYHENRGRV